MIRVRSFLTVALATLLVVPAIASAPAPTTGRSIASLSRIALRSPDGARVSFGSRVAGGKPTLVAIWASWCLPCAIEAPQLAKIRRDLGDRYNFLYINRSEGNPDPDQPAASITQFLARGGLSATEYLVADVAAYRQIVGADMRDIPEGKVGIPRVYLFDAHGRQVHTAYGLADSNGADLERRVIQATRQ